MGEFAFRKSSKDRHLSLGETGASHMSKQQEMHYKEATPQDTIAYIKEILSDVGIELCEEWSDESSIGTHSLRVTVKGTGFGTNGKGITREFAGQAPRRIHGALPEPDFRPELYILRFILRFPALH